MMLVNVGYLNTVNLKFALESTFYKENSLILLRIQTQWMPTD